MIRVGVNIKILEKILENRRIKKHSLIVFTARMYSEQPLTGFNRSKLERFIRCCNYITCSRNVGHNDDSSQPRSEVHDSDNCKTTSTADKRSRKENRSEREALMSLSHSVCGGATADAVFKSACEERVLLAYTDFNSDIAKVVKLFSKYGETVNTIRVSHDAAKHMLEIVGWSSMPLVFVKGNCCGGFKELYQLEENGSLSEWLKQHQYDLAVVGGGSGGLAAAKEAVRLGKKVVCLDFVKPSTMGTTWGLGGTCVNVGCIPKKLMHQAALLGEYIEDAKNFGWEISEGAVKLNWRQLKNAVQNHIASLNWGYRVQLKEKSVTYMNSYATFTGSHELSVKNKKGKVEKVTADRFLIAVGLRPRFPDVPGALECCISSDDLFSLSYNPGKTLCVGASYVSLECAGFLRGIGNDVTVMVRSILLRGFDQDMAERIKKHMIEHGVKFLPYVPVKYEKLKEPTNDEPGLVRVHTIQEHEDGTKKEVTEEFNTVLMAIGRDAMTDDLGLDLVGVKRSESGKIIGRREQSVSCPYIYAVGDVLNGSPELTPVAIQAGKVLMRRIFTGNSELTEYDKVPTTVFTPLEYGSCGLSEDAAIQKYGKENINVYHSMFFPLEYAVTDRKEKTHCYCKLICMKNKQDLVLGFHILTPNAGEITQGFAIALKFDAKKADFDRLIGIHPTVAENFTTLTLLKEEGQALKATGC
ncbi:Thioredoxin reductase [Dirofilaria immitis]